MACTTCKEQKSETAVMQYTAKSTTVLGKNGKNYAINQPLNGNAVQPSGGWKADIIVNTVPRTVTGRNGVAVFREAAKTLKINSVEFREIDLWLNLNIQWVQRISEKHQVVTLQALLGVASTDGTDAVQETVRHSYSKRQIPPKVWGAKGWGMLQMYLAQDVYEWSTFLILADQLWNWVNPTMNPSIGCGECYIHYGQRLDALKQNPAFEQDDARRWLVNTMNLVNERNRKPVISYEKAKQLNYWS